MDSALPVAHPVMSSQPFLGSAVLSIPTQAQQSQAALLQHSALRSMYEARPSQGHSSQLLGVSAACDPAGHAGALMPEALQRACSPSPRTALPAMDESALSNAGMTAAIASDMQPASSLRPVTGQQLQGGQLLWQSLRDPAAPTLMHQQAQAHGLQSTPMTQQSQAGYRDPGILASPGGASIPQLGSQSEQGLSSPPFSQLAVTSPAAPAGLTSPLMGPAPQLDRQSQLPGRAAPLPDQHELTSPIAPGALRNPVLGGSPLAGLQYQPGFTSSVMRQHASAASEQQLLTSPVAPGALRNPMVGMAPQGGLQSQMGLISPAMPQHSLASSGQLLSPAMPQRPAAVTPGQQLWTSPVGASGLLRAAQLARQPHRATRAVPGLLQRQLGLKGSSSGAAVMPAKELAARLQHQKTSRGHRAAVYCIAFARSGSLVVTGSDDRLVKVFLPL